MFLLGGGHILNADLSQVTEYISNQVQIFPSVQTELKDLESNILQESMEISEAGLNELIVWIVRIILVVISVIFLAFVINMILESYTLYVNL